MKDRIARINLVYMLWTILLSISEQTHVLGSICGRIDFSADWKSHRPKFCGHTMKAFAAEPSLQLSPRDSSGHDVGDSYRLSDTNYLFKSTGTTIVGVSGSDFCVLGADSRATNGRLVADKFCTKIHMLAPNVFACGAGTSADLDMLTRRCRLALKIQAAFHDSGGNTYDCVSPGIIPVQVACGMVSQLLLEERGGCEASLVVGGVYRGQATLRAIHSHGSQDALPFAALGSGGLAAMSTLEQRYRSDLTRAEAADLVKDAVLAGIQNDLGSGSQVDICILLNDGSATFYRAIRSAEMLSASSDDKNCLKASGLSFHTLHEIRKQTTASNCDMWSNILR